MTRKGKTQKLQEPQEFIIEQSVRRTGVQGQPFDLILRFTGTELIPDLFMDENVKLILEGLITNFGTILVRVNWFAEGLDVIVPDTLPQKALQAAQEALGEPIDSESSTTTESNS